MGCAARWDASDLGLSELNIGKDSRAARSHLSFS